MACLRTHSQKLDSLRQSIFVFFLSLLVPCSPVFSQDQNESDVSTWISQLSDPSFRVRELARWHLARQPQRSLDSIGIALESSNHHSGAELVDLVTEFALRDEAGVQTEATGILERASLRMTSVGNLARNALEAISELHEDQAVEILIHHSAIIGPRTFTLNGRRAQVGDEPALHINEGFTGDRESIEWIKYLKSVETVCLEGPKIDQGLLRVVVQMNGLKNIKFKHVKLTNEDLQILEDMERIEHLGLIYVEAGDEILPVLRNLPVSNSIKIYGCQISQASGNSLKQSLDDLEIFIGRGGFLGVGPIALSSTRIREVTANSAAQKAGIRPNDLITHVNSVPVATFEDLRQELGKFEAHESVKIRFKRQNLELEVEAVLQEEP